MLTPNPKKGFQMANFKLAFRKIEPPEGKKNNIFAFL